jgi:hypothetical protein
MSNNDCIDKTLNAVEDYYPTRYLNHQEQIVYSYFGADKVLDKYGPRQAAIRDEIHRQRTITNIKIFGLYAVTAIYVILMIWISIHSLV